MTAKTTTIETKTTSTTTKKTRNRCDHDLERMTTDSAVQVSALHSITVQRSAVHCSPGTVKCNNEHYQASVDFVLSLYSVHLSIWKCLKTT